METGRSLDRMYCLRTLAIKFPAAFTVLSTPRSVFYPRQAASLEDRRPSLARPWGSWCEDVLVFHLSPWKPPTAPCTGNLRLLIEPGFQLCLGEGIRVV